MPEANAAPVASVYPRSVFTMLGKTGEVHAIEDVTHVCPDSLCRDRREQPPANLVSDTMVVLGHHVLPTDVSSRWLPSIDGKWAGFGENDAPSARSNDGEPADLHTYKKQIHAQARSQGWARRSRSRLFEQFRRSIRGPARAGLWYGHFHFPHASTAPCPTAPSTSTTAQRGRTRRQPSASPTPRPE